MGRIDLRVAEKVLAHLAGQGAQAPRIAMNVSSRTIADAEARARLLALVESQRTLAPRLVFELSEFGALQDAERAQQFSESLRRLGAGFALDNFGMRDESRALVRRLRPSYIKLSQAYTADLSASDDCRFFVEALVRATQPLDIGIYAQAVEDESVLPLLLQLGVSGYQGYAAGRPEPLR
jgi:EAL domain-containing protein (putative c-di-GMP-specific phosphodiesterase class I)